MAVNPATIANIGTALVTAGATAWLARYGKIQIVEARADRAARKLEAQEERERRLQRALDTLLAETTRVAKLAEHWRTFDPFDLAENGYLRPDEFLPPDWGAVITTLGELGTASVALAGVAFGKLSDAVFQGRQIVFAVERRRAARSPSDVALPSTLRQRSAAEDVIVEILRKTLNDAADGLADAMTAAPRPMQKLVIPLHLTSTVAEELRNASQ